ncbi:hypothetical protein IWQ47_005283 [Aquimarina sp. EL_43]|uniref:hypothetical protein n=1 Tax=unclassified Aquimarina TaxID=2627091 RepID=UPI0018CB41FD|nr:MULTISPECIES: hypothetical protein [unclassified Aquimarina]MBG6133794.1 hypothetical protein [Aquimarina sp. EL_35]MBG6153946.1 hypothetical protein [Aquimarina sp. EL_32]MBG6172179.1 hypothetical protein [Aquimarina sp. EL_43]
MSDRSIGRFWQIDPLSEDYTYNATYAFQENKMGLGVELEGLEVGSWNPVSGIGEGITRAFSSEFVIPGGKDEQKIANMDNAINGTKNIVMGTVGAIGSGAYAIGSGGIGVAAGGAAAFTLSIGEISIGIGQIGDALTNNSGNTVLQNSSSIPGFIANKNDSKYASLIDTGGQFVSGTLSGGNLRTIITEGGSLLVGKGTLFGAAEMIDATMDTYEMALAIDDAVNTFFSTDNNTQVNNIVPVAPPVSSDLKGNNLLQN